jgi:hypothetical protein
MVSEKLVTIYQDYKAVLERVDNVTANCSSKEQEEQVAAYKNAATMLADFANSLSGELQACNEKERGIIEQLIGRVRCSEGLQYLLIGDLGEGKAPLLEGNRLLLLGTQGDVDRQLLGL